MISEPMSKTYSNLSQLFSNAYQWLCKSRKNHPPDSDIWSLKSTWHNQAEAIMKSFRSGNYQFDVQVKITLSSGETIALWSSQDALIIKVLTGLIQEKMKPFPIYTCYHLKGHGGLKGAERNVMKQLPKHKYFCKTDVHSYYDSIDANGGRPLMEGPPFVQGFLSVWLLFYWALVFLFRMR